MKGRAGSVLLVPITPCKMWDPLVSWSMETICMRVFLLVMVTNWGKRMCPFTLAKELKPKSYAMQLLSYLEVCILMWKSIKHLLLEPKILET